MNINKGRFRIHGRQVRSSWFVECSEIYIFYCLWSVPRMDTFETLEAFLGALNECSHSVKFVAVRSTKDFGCDGVYVLHLHRSLVKCGSVGKGHSNYHHHHHHLLLQSSLGHRLVD